MDIKKEDMPTPVKYFVTVDAEDLEKRKQEVYNMRKPHLIVDGFRKGTVPRNIAESRFGVERLYRPVIDQIFKDVYFLEPCIVGTSDYKFLGDLKKKVDLVVEFVADIKPKVLLPVFDEVRKTIEKTQVEVTDDDLKKRIDLEIKQNEKIQDSTKEVLENLDIAIIDFEGCIEGETTPFKGGTAKGYQIRVNEIVNGRKQFVDNFEDQLLGMKVDEVRKIRVTFPGDYRDKLLANKKAIFMVTLKAIKFKITPEYNKDFVKGKGFDSIEAYEESLKKQIFDSKQKKNEEDLKKQIIMKVVDQATISPIPQVMINRENEKEWSSLLTRLGKTEEQFQKENKITKEMFFDNMSPKSIEVLKTSLVLEEVADNFGFKASEDEIIQYVLKITNKLKYGESKKEKVKTDLKNNQHQYKLMETAVLNEKAMEFLVNELSK